MNWFNTYGPQAARRMVDKGLADPCEHVERGEAEPVILHTESDSFGTVGGYAPCRSCEDKRREEEANETVVCRDCKEQKKRKETFQWKWYDFYAPQGDVPLTICFECRDKPTHKRRVQQDKWDREDEFGYEDDDDYDDY